MNTNLNAFDELLEELCEENLLEKRFVPPTELSNAQESSETEQEAKQTQAHAQSEVTPDVVFPKIATESDNYSNSKPEVEVETISNSVSEAETDGLDSSVESPNVEDTVTAADISSEALTALLAEAEELNRLEEQRISEEIAATKEVSLADQPEPEAISEIEKISFEPNESSKEIQEFENTDEETSKDETFDLSSTDVPIITEIAAELPLDSPGSVSLKMSSVDLASDDSVPAEDELSEKHWKPIPVEENALRNVEEASELPISDEVAVVDKLQGEPSDGNESHSEVSKEQPDVSSIANERIAFSSEADAQLTDDAGTYEANEPAPKAEPIAKTPIDSTKPDYSINRRRASEEVSTLKMVEHIFSAIEREQLKTISKPFDDFAVELALNDLVRITSKSADEIEEAKVVEAEFKFTEEVQRWYAALTRRDAKIAVGQLRRYCETAKPALSSAALIALARFYRTSNYSEDSRAKFDMTVTRLFSKDTNLDKRTLVFGRYELKKFLKELYEDWASVEIFEHEPEEIKAKVKEFEAFIAEAKRTNSFDDLVASMLLVRVRKFKEACESVFFTPEVTAVAIESNVHLGNKYVDLLTSERESKKIKELEEKYSTILDAAISDATSKTLHLVDLLKEKEKNEKAHSSAKRKAARKAERIESAPFESEEHRGVSESKPNSKSILGVNNYLLISMLITLVLGVAAFVYLQYFEGGIKESTDVRKVNLSNSALKTYFKSAKITNKSFVAIIEPEWNTLPEDKRKEILTKIQAAGAEKGYTQVILLDQKGVSIAFASKDKVLLDTTAVFE